MTRRDTRQRIVRLVLRFLGPVLLVVVLLSHTREWGAVGGTLVTASLTPLLVALALNAVVTSLKVARWQVLLRRREIHYAWGRALGAVLASGFVALMTPGRVGDALRAHYLRHEVGTPYAAGFASVVMDRFCDLYVLLGFVALGVVRFGPALVGRLALVAWGAVALTLLGPLLLFIPGIAERLASIVYRRLLKNVDPEGFATFLDALRSYVGRSLGVTIPLTVAAFATNFAQGWLMARAIHVDLSIQDVAYLMAIASLLALLPISPSGVGVRELFFSAAFPLVGHSPAEGVSFGLLVSFVLYLSMLLPGFVAWQLDPPHVPAREPIS